MKKLIHRLIESLVLVSMTSAAMAQEASSLPVTSVSSPSTVSSQATASTAPVNESNSQFDEWLKKNLYANAAAPSQPTSGGQASLAPAPTSTPTVNSSEGKTTLKSPIASPGAIPTSSTFERNENALMQAIPDDGAPVSEASHDAFNMLLQQNMPLAPKQVIQLHQQVDIAQRAAAVPATIPPKPVSTTLRVNLAPGATPPAIRLAQGYVSALVFVDSTGAPWPIAAFDVGNPKSLNIQWDGRSNILLLQSITSYSYGDIVIRLVGLPTPITMELVSGQRVVDYRVDAHVSGVGPNTKEVPVGTVLPNSANQLLLSILDGVAPAGSKVLTVSGGESEAWVLADKIYFRTRMTVLSPGWMGKMVSPDGMNAYELPKTSSVLVSRYGEPVELRIEGF